MIAVTTPTGNVGRHVVAMLVRAGVRPRVLARDASKIDTTYVDVVEADLNDSDAVVHATEHVDALYWVTPSDPEAPDPLAHYEQLAANAARAIDANGIARTVFQSSVGAELRHGAGEIDGLALTEQRLEQTAPAITHLRCGYFFTNLLFQLDAIRGGTLPILLPPDQPLPWVAPRDIAEVATHRLLNPDWTGRHVQAVHGPEDLSWKQVSDIVGSALDTPLEAQQIPDDAMREQLAGFGMNDKQVDALVGMSTGLREGFTPEQPRDATTTTPTTLAAWAYDELRVTFVQDARDEAA